MPPYPRRAAVGPQPVTVRDEAGRAVPSRLGGERLDEDTVLPPGKLWWTFDIEFLVSDIPALGWRSYAATYGRPPDSAGVDEATWKAAAQRGPGGGPLPAYETDCHPGDLPATGSLAPAQGSR